MNCNSAPCRREQEAPNGAVSPLSDGESVIRFVRTSDWLVRDQSGKVSLTSSAFPQQELARKKGKTASVLREIAGPQEVKRRAKACNKVLEWRDDPVVAKSEVLPIRNILDAIGRREACVYADPITDDSGVCITHASVVRACPLPPDDKRLEWLKLRLKLAELFAEVYHCSGTVLVLPK
jgi:hypothetical protein